MDPGGDFAGRHVVVTGGTGALGEAVVEHLVGRGATCHVPVRRGDPPGPRPGVHVAPGVDLTDETAVVRFYAGLPDLWASIQLAGGFAGGALLDSTADDLRAMFELNAVTCYLACREAVRRMSPAGSGRLVNVAARPALVATGGLVTYATAKAAVAQLTQAIAAEVRGKGILVNAVVPSTIDTPANRRAMPRADHASWPRPAELAEAIGFLASPTNTVTTGALVPVYGRA